MDTAQWPQEIVVKPMEEILPKNTNTNTTICSSKPSTHVERKIKPHQKDQALNCPRCNSTNTKFCYYNNYSLSQPRYFCKTCKRYWTEGGSLRSIPVGGGSRKSKKSSSTNSSSANTVLRELSKNIVAPVFDPPKIHNEGSQDLNLGFSCDFKTISELIQVPNNSFIPMPISDPNSVYSSQNFSLDYGGISGDYENNLQDVQESTTSGRLLFPFEDLNLKQVSNTSIDGAEVNRDQPTGESTGYWKAFLGENGGSW